MSAAASPHPTRRLETVPPNTESPTPSESMHRSACQRVEAGSSTVDAADSPGRCESDESDWDPTERPPFSYSQLAFMAIRSLGSAKVTEIYAWIQEQYPYYQTGTQYWRNCIRHNLSTKKYFKRIDGHWHYLRELDTTPERRTGAKRGRSLLSARDESKQLETHCDRDQQTTRLKSKMAEEVPKNVVTVSGVGSEYVPCMAVHTPMPRARDLVSQSRLRSPQWNDGLHEVESAARMVQAGFYPVAHELVPASYYLMPVVDPRYHHVDQYFVSQGCPLGNDASAALKSRTRLLSGASTQPQRQPSVSYMRQKRRLKEGDFGHEDHHTKRANSAPVTRPSMAL